MRPEKATVVSDLAEKLKRSPFVLVTDYQRMKVGDFSELRNRLSPQRAEVHVVKNNFLKRAMTESGLADVSDKLTGQTAVVTGESDVAPVAKILKTFATEFKIAALKIGLVDKSILSTQDVEKLADLPSREVLLSQLLALFLAPATKLVRVLNEPASAFARLLNAKAKSMPAEPAKPAAKEAPVAEAPKTEPPSAEKTEEPKVEAAVPAASEAKVEPTPEPKEEPKVEAVAAAAPEAKAEEKSEPEAKPEEKPSTEGAA